MTLTALNSITLAFGADNLVLPDWSFPKLRFLRLFLLRESGVQSIIPLLRRQGPTLVGLQFRSAGRVESIASILSYTTALQTVVLDERDLSALADTQISFPSINRIGIQLLEVNTADDAYNVPVITHSFNQLFANNVLPSLKVVQMLAVQKEATLKDRWYELLALCDARSVALKGA